MLILLRNGKIWLIFWLIRLEIMLSEVYAHIPLGSITFFLVRCYLFRVELII